MNNASTITMTAILSTDIDIQLSHELLPILHPRNPDGSKFIHPCNTRNKIPFFGIANAIVCVKYKGKIRGIRQNKKQMNNVVSIDLQTGNKNINFKLAKTKMQLTGANSEEMGKTSFNILCAHINMLQNQLNHYRKLPEKIRLDTIDWVLKETVPTEEHPIIEINLDKITEYSNMGLIDYKLATFLWQYNDDSDTYDEFVKKVKDVIVICEDVEKNICVEDVQISSVNISNSVYNYNLGQEISLIGLSEYLHNKGFNVEFHNWNSGHLNITDQILETDEGSDNTFESDETTSSYETCNSAQTSITTKKIKAHRFSVHRTTGSIKQTSPTNALLAYEAKVRVLTAINEFLETQ
jgi:hypothetical protein